MPNNYQGNGHYVIEGGELSEEIKSVDFTIPQGNIYFVDNEQKRMVEALERIADTLDRIAPYFEERIVNRG